VVALTYRATRLTSSHPVWSMRSGGSARPPPAPNPDDSQRQRVLRAAASCPVQAIMVRLGVSVEALEGDAAGHVRRARLSDKTTIDVDVVVASLGSIRNIEW
jgi:hypothetical protein